jgi:uroporphyrinogen decarboxylase
MNEIASSSSPTETRSRNDTIEQSVFLKACRREKTPYTPVWLMRQAGRYMKDYRTIREKMTFLELCKNSSLAAEVTVTAQEKLKTDAAIIFSDILLILEPMGLSLDYLKGDGPCIKKAVRDFEAVEALQEVNTTQGLFFVFQAIREAKKKLNSNIPLIGFAGAPFTLASYMIEGGSTRDFTETKKFMKNDLSCWSLLMQKIVRSTVFYLNAQIDAGVQAVQLFDSWAGILNAREYEQFAAPHTQDLIRGLQKNVPVIHFSTKTGSFLEKISQAGGDVIGVDHRIALDKAWKKIGYDKAIQGNLDPQILCAGLKEIKTHVQRILKEADHRPGHIFNLGHGVLPETAEENAAAIVEMVHDAR